MTVGRVVSYISVFRVIKFLSGILHPTALIAPLINATPAEANRHFSTYKWTSHMHKPALRLVSLNSSLSLSFSFLRVWEIHDEFEYKIFISTSTTVAEVIDEVVRELGLAETLPIPGGGNLEYTLEEVWTDGSNSGACLSFSHPFYNLWFSRVI